MPRFGVTIPIDSTPLAEQRAFVQELEALGYTDLWSSEANGVDGAGVVIGGVEPPGTAFDADQVGGAVVEHHLESRLTPMAGAVPPPFVQRPWPRPSHDRSTLPVVDHVQTTYASGLPGLTEGCIVRIRREGLHSFH